MSIIMALFMGLIGGPAIAWAMNQKGSLAAFEKRKQKFAEGKGKNPELDVIGPHKGFGYNAMVMGIVFGLIGLFVGSLVRL